MIIVEQNANKILHFTDEAISLNASRPQRQLDRRSPTPSPLI
jgi:hypothetical protein